MMTPCKNQCFFVSEVGCCVSCGRTKRDLEQWTSLTDLEQRYLIAQAKERLINLQQEGKIGP